MQGRATPRRVRWWAGALAFGVALLVALVVGDVPGPGPLRGVQAAAHPYRFNLGLWEALHLADLLPRAPSPDGARAVERYFALAASLRAAEADLTRTQALAATPRGDDEVWSAVARREEIRTQMGRLEPVVRRELQRQVGEVLRAEGLFPRIPGGGVVAFPPVVFTLEEAPRALVISPRDRIALLEVLHLRAAITTKEVATLEEALARRGLSALVEPLGGLSTYPAIVAPSADLRFVLGAIAHEWTHHYLFFHPLGQRYGDGGDMATVNETVANVVGAEVAARLLGEPPPLLRPVPTAPPPREGDPTPAFDASRVLRETRQEAERLLAAGRVDEAEALMEMRRRELAEHGVFIRRLNQAFYAFHGTYADSPASVSPVFDQLRAVRRAEPSLGAFLRTVAQVRSPSELKALAASGSRPR